MKRILILLAAAVTLGGCSASTDDSDDVSVMASMYPAAFMAERVGGDLVNVSQLTAPGVDPHDFELSPRRTIDLIESDVVVWFGGIQPAVDDAVTESKRDDDVTVDLGEGLGIDAAPDEGEDADHDDHDHDGLDPHVWLDPKNMITAVDRVRDALVAASPEHAEEVTANAADLRSELEDLDRRYSEGLATCDQRVIVTTHAAFGHLAKAHDLEQIAISGIDPHAEPSTASLARVTDLVREKEISTIFTERLAAPALSEVVTRETGATTAVLDPVEGLTDETADETYLTLMDANLTALRKALECR